MNKLFRRFLAYTIDMMVVILVVQSISGIPQINPQLDDYNKYYDDYMESYQSYSSFKQDLKTDFSDKELSIEEYDSLVKEHDLYKEVLDKYYKDNTLTENNYKKLNNQIDGDYNKEYKKVYYQIEKNSILYFVLYLVVVFAYFVGFNYYTNGQTLGKKLMRLKIVDSKDIEKRVGIWSYIIRAIILYQVLYYLIKLIGVYTMSADLYYTVTSVFYSVQYYLEMLIVLMSMIRIDGRGPHDLLARTRVMQYDRKGQEVKDKFDLMLSKKKNDLKKEKKKIIEEPTDEE